MKKIMMVVCFASIIFATASCDNKNENCNLYNYSSNFPHFIGFPACPLVK